MHIDKKSLSILTTLYDKYLKQKILTSKIRGGWAFNVERTKSDLSAVEKEIKELEEPLFETVDQMRIKVMEEFIKTLPKDSYRDEVHSKYFHCGYQFDCHLNLYIFNVHARYDNFISRVDNIFNPILFRECLEQTKSGKYFEKSIQDLYGYFDFKTFRLDKYKELYKSMLSIFPEKKETKITYYRSRREEYLEPWERDEYDDSYGAWLEKGGPYKDDFDDPYESAYDPFDGGADW